MQLTKLTGALLAVLLVTGSAAALPAAAGAQASDNAAANENATSAQADTNADETAVDAAESDDTDEQAVAPNQADADRRGPPEAVGPAGERGPPTSMPAPVPDFVGDIHKTINDHVAGTLEGDLGQHISDLTPGDESDNEGATAPDAASESADGASNATEQ